MKLRDLAYSPFFGKLYWLKDSPQTKKGDFAGCSTGDGYWRIIVDGKSYLAHRLIWQMHYGTIPEGMEIDHKNEQRDCNYIWNLRLSERSQNLCNRGPQINSKSGVKGVNWSNKGYWEASVQFRKKRYRKCFNELKEAEVWVRVKREELHGEFTNHG